MLAFLLDAHLPAAVVAGVRRVRPGCRIEHVADWRGGLLRQASDEGILLAALDAGLMLVTYDVGTIPVIVHGWLAEGRPSPGVAFIRTRAIAPQDVGAIVRRLVELYDDPIPLDPDYPVVYLHGAR